MKTATATIIFPSHSLIEFDRDRWAFEQLVYARHNWMSDRGLRPGIGAVRGQQDGQREQWSYGVDVVQREVA